MNIASRTLRTPCLAVFASVLFATASHGADIPAGGSMDHAGIIRGWDASSLERGEKLYNGICITCHGNLTQAGSLPTSRPFWKEPFKNGNDPYSIYKTLSQGLGQMPAWTFLTPEQRYDAIHYIRETFVKPHNPSAYFKVTDDYLAALPKGSGRGERTAEMAEYAKGPKYLRMDFGPALFWTIQVASNNIAYKGIAVRLDDGPGGISRGHAWMLYDHDTLRVAAAWAGDRFIDWRGIAFDGSHGTHAAIGSPAAFVNPVGPGWARPGTTGFDDPRIRGRDGRPYGPLPRDWAHLQGVYYHSNRVVIAYTVGGARVLEQPGLERSGDSFAFSRTLNIDPSPHDLWLRIAPESVHVAEVGNSGALLRATQGHHLLHVPASTSARRVKLLIANPGAGMDPSTLYAFSLTSRPPADLAPLTRGGPARWNPPLATQGRLGTETGPFAVDELTPPADADNPWHTWMRFGGFDFFPDGRRAAICTWNGDVWVVDGIDDDLAQLTWKRIASGLFQPLGVKIVEGVIHVTCRDQIARLHDLDGDGEIDFIENFNNDHQVTEHFHEFAMGLQTDREGNFYYAKSARHALPAVVPHHGTLLKVSRDGSRTEILASGFRAANGVCVNDDGTFFVTDQEGHWTPKNRINWVHPGGFYGNMFGYHDRTSSDDADMEQPLVWITNAMDRSPGELLWVRSPRWGALNGSLLNLSYGTGRIFVVPHENIGGRLQGGVVQLPIPDSPTGTMRGRFHPGNGHLYTCGLYAWAGNRQSDGGFHRIRATGAPAHLPIGLHARTNGVELQYSDRLDRLSATSVTNHSVKVWGLQRTANYGSKHLDEHPLTVTRASLTPDRKSLFLEIPGIQPTWCMEIESRLRGSDGTSFVRTVHNTIHQLAAAPAAAARTNPPYIAGPTPRLNLPGESLTVAGRPAFVFLPPESKRSIPQPWVFYAPTLPGFPDGAERWMHEQFLDAGIAVAGVDVGEGYGSPKSLPVFDALYRELTVKRQFARKPCLFGRSRGGLWVTSWAIANPDLVAGIIGIYPVFDFRTYPGLTNAAPAYGLTPPELSARTAEFNPIARVGELARAGIPAALIHGDIDKVVPLRENSGEFVRAYKDAGAAGLVKLIVLEGQGHNYFEGFFHSRELVEFAIERAFEGARVEPVSTARLQRGREIYQRHCFACHQLNGQGIPGTFPPLAGSDLLASNVEQGIRALCEGLTGEIVVNGHRYAGAMPAAMIDDGEVADVLTFVLNNWGNPGGQVDPQTVRRVRSKTAFPTVKALKASSTYPPLPKAPEGFALREVVRLPVKGVRMASDGQGKTLYILTEYGDVWRLETDNGALRQVLWGSRYLEKREGDLGGPLFVLGLAMDKEKRLYIASNQQNKATLPVQNIVTIYRTTSFDQGDPANPKPWFQTNYPGNAAYVHGVEHIAFGPDGSLYVGNGARTDAGQTGGEPTWYGGGETPITSSMWRLDPKAEHPTLEIHARGLRNAYGFCWNDRGDMFATENGPDADAPEELNHIQKGHHYGFPYTFSNWTKKAYGHTPDAPPGLVFTLPIANLGPDGGFAGEPIYTFDPHSGPGGIVFLGDDFPEGYRGTFLLTRFGNFIRTPKDNVGFDVLHATLTRKTSGAYEARIHTLLAPLGRPIDIHLGPGRVFICEYSRPTTSAGSYALPGRILELSVRRK